MSDIGANAPPFAARRVDGRVVLELGPLFLEALAVVALVGVGLAVVAPVSAGLFGGDWRLTVVTLWVYLTIAALVISGLGWHPHERFGAANTITTCRAALTALVAGFVLEADRLGPGGDAALSWFVVGTATLALVLDGLDGWVARREGTQSELGGRFDMEVDAFLILLLSLFAFLSGKAGIFVLMLGLMRYAYLATHAIMPTLPKDLEPSFTRKAICVLQVGVLCVIATPLLAPPVSDVLALVALVLLSGSFGRDLADQVRRRGRQSVAAP